jgi:hypothetical protein
MVNKIVLVFILTFGLFSCKNSSRNSGDGGGPGQMNGSLAVDSSGRFTVDDFPVADSLLGSDSSNNGRKIESGGTISLDKAWFANDSLKQTLVFEIYTDDFRAASYLFNNKDIPDELIERMELNDDSGDTVSKEQKVRDFMGFLKKARQIGKNFFVTKKGLRLGDKQEKAQQIYGRPDYVKNADGVEEDNWLFVGENVFDGKADLKGKPLAKDSYGHQVTMFFRQGRLIGLILSNDIP